MPNVSIIIPVYNGSQYLERCVDSVLSQTMEDIQIILVDDGSTDNSGETCDKYGEKNSRITVLHKENGGLGSARNYGLSSVLAEYVGFVDCDDWVNPDTYDYLYKIAKENDADISSGKFAIVYSETDKIPDERQEVRIYEGIEKQKVYLEIGIKDRSSQYSVCTKIYRKKMFENIRFPEGQLYEDVVTNYNLLGLANKFVLSDKYVYNYYMKSASITRNKCSNRDLDLIKVGKQIESLTMGTDIETLGKVMSVRTNFSLLVKSQMYGFDESVSNKEELTNKWLEEIKTNYMQLMLSGLPISRKGILTGYRYLPNLTKNLFGVFRKLMSID